MRIMHRTVSSIGHPRRPPSPRRVGAAAATYAPVISGGRADDPIVTLSDGTNLTLNATMHDDLSAVARIADTLHAPTGPQA
jgi:hypothetical protein